jgi:hypothetical protein
MAISTLKLIRRPNSFGHGLAPVVGFDEIGFARYTTPARTPAGTAVATRPLRRLRIAPASP